MFTSDQINSKIYSYVLCGWRTQSEIPLTSVPTSVHNGETVDIRISVAHGPSPISNHSSKTIFEHSDKYSLIGIQGVSDFEITTGKISLWPANGATQKEIEIFLFGPAWAALCCQRGLWPLHASAIATRDGIMAFAGHSGAGKSTIAALLGLLDYELVTDDVLPISFNQHSVPGACPYLRRLKLQGNSVAELALTPTEVVSETLDKGKYFVSPKSAADDNWIRLARVYLLEIDPAISTLSIDRITGTEAVRILIDQTYHFRFIVDSGRRADHLAFCTQLATEVAIYRLRRSPSLRAGPELQSIIREHLEHAPT